MTGRPAAVIAIGESGVTVRLTGGDEFRLAFGRDPEGWRALRGRLAGCQPIIAVVAATATFDLCMSGVPTGWRHLRRAVAEAAPVVPDQLAWTRPRQLGAGQPAVTAVRRAWLDERLGLLERAAGGVLQPVAEADLAPFLYRSPAARRRLSVTLAIAALPLLQLALLVAVPYWRESGGVGSAPGMPAESLFARPGLAASVTALAAQLPPGATFAALGRDRSGAIRVELDTPDPERLRRGLVSRAFMPGLADSGSARLVGKAFRLTFGGVLELPAPPDAGSASPLPAASAAAAATAATARLRALAGNAPLVVEVLPGTAGPGQIAASVSVSGQQAAVLAYADRLESSRPVMRFGEWRLVPDAAGVRLSGTVIVPWVRG